MKKLFLFAALVVSGCVVNPKYKDSEALNAIDKMGYPMNIIKFSDGEWRISFDLSDNVTIAGKGGSLGAAYEDALKNKSKLCE